MNRNDLPEPNATCEVCGQPYRRCNKCIELRNRGIETWRIHCDCMECYQAFILLSKDDITKEEYEQLAAIKLPENRKYTKENKTKVDELKKKFTVKETYTNNKGNNKYSNNNSNKKNDRYNYYSNNK